jgi:sortase (surface protein transpeptidase)
VKTRFKVPASQKSRQSIVALAAVAVLGVFGTGALFFGLQSQQQAPRPPLSVAGSLTTTTKVFPTRPSEPTFDYSLPVSISIPAIKVKSDVTTVGKNPDGTIAVPSGKQYNKAAWYKHSPSPGQSGASVIEGHVDSPAGPSVFFRLGDVRPKDKILVKRADGKTVVFIVEGVREYTKDEFPTDLVYGPANRAALRLITCSGRYNAETGEYQSNIIVFATLSGSYKTQSA